MAEASMTNRIKNPEQVLLPDGWVLLEAIKKKSKIVQVDPSNPLGIDHFIMLQTRGSGEHSFIKDGDVILDFDAFIKVDFECDNRLFRAIPFSAIRLAVKSSNFKEQPVMSNLITS